MKSLVVSQYNYLNHKWNFVHIHFLPGFLLSMCSASSTETEEFGTEAPFISLYQALVWVLSSTAKKQKN
jgi:hypothetical protein